MTARPFPLSRRLVMFAALALGGNALLALLAWDEGRAQAVAFGPGYVPIAPITAVLFLLFSLALIWRAGRPESQAARWFELAVALGVGVVSTLVLAGDVFSFSLPWDGWFVREAKSAGGVRLGVMSPLAAVAFGLAAIAFCARHERSENSRWARFAGAGASGMGLLIGAVVTLGYAAGAPIYYDRETVPMALLTAVGFLLLNGALIVSGLAADWLRVWWSNELAKEDSASERLFRRRVVLVGGVLLTTLVVVGFYYVRVHQAAARIASKEQLDAVTDLKAMETSRWREERLSEARFLSRTPEVAEDVENFLAQPTDARAEARVRGWLEPIKGGERYDSVVLLDVQGRAMMGVPTTAEAAAHFSVAQISTVVARRAIEWVDFERAPGDEKIHLHLLAPVLRPGDTAETPGRAPIGIIALSIDPRKELFPLIQKWPTPSATAETVLVRRDGDEIVYLNDLRHRPGAALTQRRSIDEETLAAAAAMRGDLGTQESHDFRGVAVLSAARRIPQSPWLMISKIDLQEAYATIMRDVWDSIALTLTVAVAAGFMMAFVWRSRRAAFLLRTLRAEEERNTLAARLAMLTRYANDMILLIDESGRIVEANERALACYGYTLEELQQLPPGALRPPEARASLGAQLAQLGGADGGVFETLHLRKDGTVFPVEVSGRLVEIGGRRHKLGIYRDITQRKAHEMQIARLTRVYAALSQVNAAIVRAHSREELFQNVCRVLVEYGGLKMAWIGCGEAERDTIVPAAHFGDSTGYLEGIRISAAQSSQQGRGPTGIAFREGRTYTCNDFATDPATKLWREAGRVAGFAASISLPVRLAGKVVAALTAYAAEKDFFGEREISLLEEAGGDISFALDGLEHQAQRRQAEAAVRASEAKFRALYEYSLDGFMLTVPDGRVLSANPAACRMLGRTEEELITFNRRDLIVGDERLARLLTQRTQTGSTQGELTMIRGDGSPIDVEVASTIFEIEGEPRTSVAIHDITERKRAEESLRLLSRAIDQSTASVVMTDTAGAITYVNPAFTKVTGYAAEEVIGKNPRILKSGSTPAETYQELWGAISAGRDWRGEFQNKRKNGENFWELAAISPVKDEHGRISHFVAVKEDITERKKLQEQFLRAQRLESIGMLASGIAHDLNNVLAPIGMVAPLLRTRVHEPRDLRLLETLEKSVERGSGLVRQILGFAHGIGGEPRLVQAKHLLRDIISVIAETFPKSIEVEDHVPSELWPILANPTQVHQVLLNLCVNARDAMPHGGTLRVGAENCRLDEQAAAVLEGARPGAWVVLCVEDTGTGIPPEVLARMWEPFFTTKTADCGTGLGLSTVRGIVETHRGFVTVRTDVGRGTSFRIYLPAAEVPDTAPRDQGEPPAPGGHGELILVVDDEVLIREATKATLTDAGYRVITASDGAEGAAIFQARAAEFSAVVTDLDMPNLDGEALARIVHALRPTVKIIAMSGLAERYHAAKPEPFIAAVMAKPFTAETLLGHLRQLLLGEPSNR